ncbi:hypothetical protein [Edaphobacter aggregans]|uniref:hypothetical protein n=1 Tax=Edaphobacter aggregans TaxID=570835 RepID=UPI00054CDF1F|nr:hypothetical protein [Edaphobacter aggregans]
MHFPLTLALLGLLTGAALVLRVFWWRIPSWLRRFVLGLAFAMVLLRFLFLVSSWSTTSTYFNDLLCWTAVAGYEILLIRFSLMRPQWLTALSALILMLPIFGSTLLTPLTRIFYWSPADISSIGGPYICEKSPWDLDGLGNSGMDLIVFYRPPFAPFVRHLVQRASFGDDQCDAAASSAVADPARKVVHFRCPARRGQQDIDYTLPLP